jgi:segregation and condensation protein A
MRLADLELDLDVFAGPFDLLATLILREEIDLLEVDLAEIVIAYVDHLERRGELDLEAATEFLVLIAALLELKSKLMLPGEEIEQLIDIEPAQAAEELLARLLDAHRFRAAAGELCRRLAEQEGFRFRSAPPPAWLRRESSQRASAAYDPRILGEAIGALLVHPPPVDLGHVAAPTVSLEERLRVLRAMLARGSFRFSQAIAGADRVTVAVTLFALLELHKQGELTWVQEQPFGEVLVHGRARGSEVAA